MEFGYDLEIWTPKFVLLVETKVKRRKNSRFEIRARQTNCAFKPHAIYVYI
jgi:hypothetical protein